MCCQIIDLKQFRRLSTNSILYQCVLNKVSEYIRNIFSHHPLLQSYRHLVFGGRFKHMSGTPGQVHRRYGVKKSENLKMVMSPPGMGTCCTPGGKHVYSVYLHPFAEANRASQTNLNSRHICFHSSVLEANMINKNSLPFCPVGWQQNSLVFLWMQATSPSHELCVLTASCVF